MENNINGPPVVTNQMITKWQEAITEKKSLRSLRRILLAFRAGAHINEDGDGKSFAYRITSAAVVVCLKYVIPVFDHHLNFKEGEVKKKHPNSCKKWKNIESFVKSYLQNILHMLKNLSENDMIYFIVKESEKCVPYYLCFPKLSRNWLKTLLELWGSAEDKVRIVSFLNIRKLATVGPSPMIDICLKGIYMTFVRNCRTTTVYTISSTNFMTNCGVEIYGLDLKASYQFAFVYIRQLAIHLRNSMLVKSKESYQSVYNWQFIHCLEFWSRVLTAFCDQRRIAETGKESPLQPLIYPLVQTGTFIPLAPYLFDILESPELRQKPKPSTLKPLDFSLHLKAPKCYLHTRAYQDGICEEIIDVLLEYYACFCLSVAFPELVVPAIVQIKRHIKKSKNVKMNKQLHNLVEKFEQNSKYIEQHRAQIEFAPNDRVKVQAFMKEFDQESTPLGSYAKSARKLKDQHLYVLSLCIISTTPNHHKLPWPGCSHHLFKQTKTSLYRGFLTLHRDPYWKGVLRECEKENLVPISADKSTITTKSTTARTPFSVESWTSFFKEVQFDDNIRRYPQPSFKNYDKSYDISNEEDVRGALKNNVFDNLHIITTSQQPIEVFKRISKEDSIIGVPDFIYKRAGKLLLVIEVKTLEISVVDILRQIFGYLVINKLQYGILSTYNQHWFLRRPKDESRALYFSYYKYRIKKSNSLSVLCIYTASRADTECPSLGKTPPSSPSPNFDDSDSSDNNILESDYEKFLKSSK
ncbi:4399_t:CDS:10 [Ambispora gerdemannii]|uniref:4399_t:CDS:1 n=1 Tax=Ambispora gerdemannii TaxID=144530 RepID=A0A9N9AE65_9GLOM|nr:4399_t:CDS:10 [Ambispora gerdemannii]